MAEYPVQLVHDTELYKRIQKILGRGSLSKILGRGSLSKDIKDSIEDLCTGDVKGNIMLDSEIEKSLVRLISHYKYIFPENNIKPFDKDHKYWVTNEQFVALYWECLKCRHTETMEELFSNYLLGVENSKKLTKNDTNKLQQLDSKNLKEINYFELIILESSAEYGLAGKNGLVFKNAKRIYRDLVKEGALQRKGKTRRSPKTYLMINPDYILPIQPRLPMQHNNNLLKQSYQPLPRL